MSSVPVKLQASVLEDQMIVYRLYIGKLALKWVSHNTPTSHPSCIPSIKYKKQKKVLDSFLTLGGCGNSHTYIHIHTRANVDRSQLNEYATSLSFTLSLSSSLSWWHGRSLRFPLSGCLLSFAASYGVTLACMETFCLPMLRASIEKHSPVT